MPLIAPQFAFGDSVIDAFNPTTWAFEGSIDDQGRNPQCSLNVATSRPSAGDERLLQADSAVMAFWL
jgi:hypothetical protein